ncbi:MAG: hypothetical protein ACRDRJ_06460 [Streptosporangiaceae bacterium]
MKDEDGVDLDRDDFRKYRRYLAPHLFAWPDEDEPSAYPAPSDLIPEESWDHAMTLPTDVALRSSSYEGSAVARLSTLESQWIYSWPELGEAPFMEEVALLADEEFDALVFNALHGYYRQAIGCLRNALETMMAAAALAVTNNRDLFVQWRNGEERIGFRRARRWLRDSADGLKIDGEIAPLSVFGDDDSSWANSRYARLCAYAHSQGGYNNADFWESNGPIFVPRALAVVEQEFRETLALCYLLLRLGWPAYRPGPGPEAIIVGPRAGWEKYEDLLRSWLALENP